MTEIQQDKELRQIRESLMPVIEQEILESGFLDEHDKNVGGDLYTPQNNQKLTASAIADILSVKLQPFIQDRDKELERRAAAKIKAVIDAHKGLNSDSEVLALVESSLEVIDKLEELSS